LTEQQLQPMLQKLLADRFKLKVHRDEKEMSAYALVVARGGARLKPATGPENRDSFRLRSGELTGQGVSMKDFARFVGGKLGLLAVDKTGLPGLYDFDVKWTEEPDPSANADPRDAHREATLHALQEHLGLKIIPQRVGVEMLVIDSVEKASDN